MTNTCIIFLEKTARRFPDKIAVRDDKKQYSFKELRHQALKVSTRIPLGWSNQPIAVLLPKTADSLVSLMGVLYSGNFYIPLDVKSPPERLARILEDLSPRAIITSSNYTNLIPSKNVNSLQIIDVESVVNDSSIEIPEDYTKRFDSVIDTDPIYCLYTSGSTGVPKGVVIPHRGIDDMARWAEQTFAIDETVIIGNQSPFFFDLSTIDIYLMIKTGATLCLIPQYLFSFPARLLEFIVAHNINCICWVPSAFTLVVAKDALANVNLNQLNRIFFIGEVMPSKTLNYWKKHIPDALYCNMYGPTETTFGSTFYIINREFEDDEPLPIGHPCKNTDVLVLNSINDEISGDELGELCIRGSSLALGYLNDPEKTSAAFIQNPLNTRYPERIYRTGDLARYNENGELCYCGRSDSQIKHAGYRIELGEIESAISSIDYVIQACVLYDKEKCQIVSFYVSNEKHIDVAFIRNSLVEKLPKHMIPTLYYKINELPLNENGKVDRLLLSKKLLKL